MEVKDGIVCIQPILFIAITCVVLLLGILIGFFVINKIWKSIFSLESFMLFLSFFVLIGSITFQTLGLLESFASAVVTVFSSVVFSWLLTKSSNREELKAQEQELAKRSYRHINYIETASITAEKTINQYVSGPDSDKLDSEEKLILSRALDYIGYIRGGINTCKMDWFDLLSEEGKKSFSVQEDVTQSIIVEDLSINQEDV